MHQRDAIIRKIQQSVSESSEKIRNLQIMQRSLSGNDDLLNKVSETTEKDPMNETNLSRMIEISVGNGEQIRSLTVRTLMVFYLRCA